MSENIEIILKRYKMWATGIKKKKKKVKRNKINGKGFVIKYKFKKVKKEHRLSFLISHLKLDKPDILPVDQCKKRRGFDSGKGWALPLTSISECYICGGKATLRHHVIPICKGGKNKINNIVPLCNPCHCRVHPHMQKGYISKPRKFIQPWKSPLVKPKQDIVVISPVSHFENFHE